MVGNVLIPKGFVAAYLLIILMLGGAVVLEQRDILFPEIAGMAMGVLVFPVPHWIKKPVHLWLSPTLAAFLGTFMNHLSLALPLKLGLGLVMIVILMHLFRVNFGPTIPAGLLPIFLGLHDYVFAASTAVFTFVIMLAAFRMIHPEKSSNQTQNFRKKTDTLLITIVFCLWIGLALTTGLDVLVVPPVFALIFEVFHTANFNWRLIPSRLAVLTTTAVLSVGVYHLLDGSIIWVGVVNVVITVTLCKMFKAPVPVAFGVSLMPLIVPAWGTWGFPAGVFVTTGVLMVISAAYRQFRNKKAMELTSIQ